MSDKANADANANHTQSVKVSTVNVPTTVVVDSHTGTAKVVQGTVQETVAHYAKTLGKES